MSYEQLPQELRERRQWVAWKLVPDPARPEKPRKVPVNPMTGANAASNDPSTWGTFEEAVRRKEQDRLNGIGYVFSSDDPYCGLDFDHDVFCEDGELQQWLLDYLWRLGSYAEYSQSGKGVHVIVKGKLPPGGRHGERVEMYDALRFFVCTGNVIGNYAQIREAQEAVNQIYAWEFPAKEPKAEPAERPAQPVALDDYALIAKAQAASNGAKFTALWDGNTAGYPSPSEADMALCGQLAFWTAGNKARMDSLFRWSGLYRPEKWDRVHHANGSTYGEHTIAVAVANARNFYDGNGRQPPDLTPVVQDGALEPPPWYDEDGQELPPPPSVPDGDEDKAEARRTEGVARAELPATPIPDLSLCPPLPDEARLPAELEADACPWLDAYIEFSRRWSPRGYEGFHEAVGLWVLSTIAARRVKVDLGGERFTNLYFANVARSSVWAKSTTHKIGAEVIEAAGLRHLLAPDDATPQALLQRMAHRTVEDWDTLTPDRQELTRLRIAFAGQRGWDFDEFGHKVSAMMRDSGTMADFRGLLRMLDDCPPSFEYATIGRGSNLLDRPYLSLLASMTPADMQPYAKRGGPLWGDGFWARFAFVAPAPEEAPSAERFAPGARIIPPTLLTPLRKWHGVLGTPIVDVIELTETDDNGKPRGKKWSVNVGAAPIQTCILGAGVYDAFYNYHDALLQIARANDNTDLDGNYTRFAEKALRVSILLASLENGGLIELRHWARAQATAERWRQSLHNLYRTVNAGQKQEAQDEERVMSVMRKLKAATPTDVHRYLPGMTTKDVMTHLDTLARAGALEVGKSKKGTPRYTVIES